MRSRFLAAVAMVVVLTAGCIGGNAASTTSTTAPSGTTTSTADTIPVDTTTTAAPPERLTQFLQALLVLDERELGPEFLELVPTGVALTNGPMHFSSFFGQWVGQVNDPYSSELPRGQYVETGTRLYPSEAAAIDAFQKGAAAATAGETPRDYQAASTFDVAAVGDETIGIRVHLKQGTAENWETQVVFRRGELLGYAIVGRNEETDDSAFVEQFAALVDGRVVAVLAGELTPPGAPVPGDSIRRPYVLAPQLQLRSFEFEAFFTISASDQEHTISVTGAYQGWDRMRCDVDVIAEGTYHFIWDGIGVAVETADGWRYLADDDPRQRLARACPGHADFFDGFGVYQSTFYGYNPITDEYNRPVYDEVEVRGMAAVYLAASNLEWVLGNRDPASGSVEFVEMLFNDDLGWPIAMDYTGDVDYSFFFGGELQLVPARVEYAITNPNDPSIVVDIPETILAP